MRPRSTLNFRLSYILLLAAIPAFGQTPTKPGGQKPAGGSNAIKAPAAPASPQSKHFPILLIASGSNPAWSVRIGMKGAERLDRPGYPPIVLEPGEIAADESGKAWTYKAKDVDTNAEVTLQLAREACASGAADSKFTFSVLVTHAQIGQLRGCARIAPEEFPEFKQKNLDDDDPDKKKVTTAPAITGFKAPVAVAFLSPTGQVMLARGAAAKMVAPSGSQLALSHDGKRLLFTRGQGSDRTILLYDATAGRTTELQRGPAQSAFWSPDDSQIAFLKMAGQDWTVWIMPAASADRATQLSNSPVWALHGWQDAHTVLASSVSSLYFLKTESPPIVMPIRDVFGDGFGVASSDSIRANPNNPDLLLVSATSLQAKAGAADAKAGATSAAFLYEIASKRRAVVTPAGIFAQDAEWSRDGIQIFFTGRDAAKAASIWRIFWDGSGLKKQRAGSGMVVGQ